MLLNLNPRDFDQKTLSPEEILRWFDLCDAVWLHDGDPQKPHAELVSGMCSNGYINCGLVLCYPNISEILARQLVQKLNTEMSLKLIDWVVGSAYGAITFSYEVARVLGVRHGFVEKDLSDSTGKQMVWKRLKIPAGSKVLQVEELITTSRTVSEVRRAINEGNSEPVDFPKVVGALIHRPPILPAEYDGVKVITLIEREIWAVDQKDCTLCQAGSPRYRPKTYWRELTGKR